jgi:hypothetical protein
MLNKYISYGFCLLFTGSLLLAGCKKFVTIPPPVNQVVNPLPFSNDAIAVSTVAGIYSEMMNNNNQFSNNGVTLYAGLSADELYYYTPGFRDDFRNNLILQSDHATLASVFWTPAYKYIYTANLCIEQLNKAGGLSPSTKNRLLGECKFLRAFCYFQLVNLFGPVPLETGSDYIINATLPRADTAAVYRQIITDLEDAVQILPADYPGTDKARANKWAATALLARVYLYSRNWSKAEELSSAVIANAGYTLVSNLNNVFLKNSTETILQFQPVSGSYNTWEGYTILPASANASPTYLITPSLLNAFDSGDQRKNAWVGSRQYLGQTLYYPFKYKIYNGSNLTEYYMILRLGEQYLIRAEARAQAGNLAAAVSDINIIRTRAGLPAVAAANQAAVLQTIEKERRLELFAEWGHRWNDLRRTGRVNAVMAAEKPLTWTSTAAWWPIPITQINANPALTQNPGY